MLSGIGRLEALREHEVDQGVGAVHVLRTGEDAGELDLAEAAVGDGRGRCRLRAASCAKITSAGGLVAYETTIGRLPLLPPAPENGAVYASSQPSTTSTPFARSRRQ